MLIHNLLKMLSVMITDHLRAIIHFGGGVILARILEPSEFGLVAYLTALVGISSVFKSMQLETYLVQCQKNKLEIFGGTAISINMIITLAIFFIATVIGYFFLEQHYFFPFIVILFSGSVSTFFFSYDSILVKELEFKKINIINLSVSIFAYTFSIWMAYNGYGFWSLVILIFIQNSMPVLFKFFITPYKVTPKLFANTFQDIFKYAKFGMIGSATGKLPELLIPIFIKTYVDLFSLGIFQRAQGINNLFNQFFSTAINAVASPTYSKLQTQKENLVEYFSFIIGLNSRLSYLAFTSLFLLADQFIFLVYTEKWMPVVPYIKILIAYAICHQFIGVYRVFLFSIGDTKLVAYTNILISSIFLLTLIPLFEFYGITGICIALNISNFLGLLYIIYTVQKTNKNNIFYAFIIPYSPTLFTMIIYLLINSKIHFNNLWFVFIIHIFILLLLFGMFSCFFDLKFYKNFFNKSKLL